MNRIRFALLAALLIALTSCGGGGSSTPPPPPAITLTIAQTTLPYGIIGQPYPGAQLTASGGTPPYTFATSSVPAGMNFSSDGKLTGTTPGTVELIYPFVITVNDSAGHSGIGTVSLNTYLPLSATIFNREISSGVPYQGSLTILMTQSNLTATAKLVSGSLPPGLSFGTASTQGPQPTVAIVGTPTQRGIFSFTVEVTDSLTPPRTAQVPLKMFVDIQELGLPSDAILPNGKRTQPYQYAFYPRGGTSPVNCDLAPGSGPLPDGISAGPNCSIGGTPTTLGKFDFTWRATDSGNPQQVVTKAFSLTVIEPISVGTIPDGTTGEIYTANLPITGGTPPYSILSVDARSCCYVIEKHDFSLHGVPYDAGPQFIYLIIQDAQGQTINPTVRFNVNQGPFRLATDNLPRMKAGQFYQGYLSMVSGTAPIKWTIDSGSLPDGIAMGTAFPYDLMLLGSPTAAGTYPVTLRATDSSTPPQIFQLPLSIQVYSTLPRNDSIASADFMPRSSYRLHDGTATRSISPYSDPVDLVSPDQDYYHFRAFAGETLQLTATAPMSRKALDPLIEIVDSNGQRFSTCRDPSDDKPDADGHVDLTPLAFDDTCMNDDIDPGVVIDSKLTFRVPGASGTMVDFYLHVLDFRGDARPDFNYAVDVIRNLGYIE